jgi:hypothetical protein
MDYSWLDITEILLLLLACSLCYRAGKVKGAVELANALIDDGKIKIEDLK